MLSTRPGSLGIGLIGAGGYGNVYLTALLNHQDGQGCQILGVVDPCLASCQHLPELRKRGVPIYETIEEFYNRHRPELTVISTPTPLHCSQSVYALSHESHVLCEKPMCPTVEQADELTRARDAARRHVSIGYQWSFSAGIEALKRDINAGVFGEPKRFRTLVLWPRDEGYYKRNNWSGRRFTQSGAPVFDSPLNNACAHHLHNMLYLLGESPDRSASVATVSAELYRANDIETFDTAAVRIWSTGGVEMICIVSHATHDAVGPLFTLEFEEATVTLAGEQPTASTIDGPDIVAQFKDGTIKHYSSPERDPDRKLWAAVESARTDIPTICGIEAALPHLLVNNAASESMPEPIEFPRDLIRTCQAGNSKRRNVVGLDAALQSCFAVGQLPSELSIPWAKPGKVVRVPQPMGRKTFQVPIIPKHVDIYPVRTKLVRAN